MPSFTVPETRLRVARLESWLVVGLLKIKCGWDAPVWSVMCIVTLMTAVDEYQSLVVLPIAVWQAGGVINPGGEGMPSRRRSPCVLADRATVSRQRHRFTGC